MAHPEDLARRALELTDAQDWPGREALLSSDCEFVSPAGTLHGPAATTAYSAPFVGVFPDARHQLDLVAAAGDVVLVEGMWVGTHQGPLVTPDGEVPATGRPITLRFAATFQVRGDLISAVHIYYDQLTFMAQLGLLPQPQAA